MVKHSDGGVSLNSYQSVLHYHNAGGNLTEGKTENTVFHIKNLSSTGGKPVSPTPMAMHPHHV